MSLEELHELLANPLDISFLDLKSSRSELLSDIEKNSSFDVVVIGGGIHGTTFAHASALNGLRTLLLERNDYALEASSRSSKMAHGGLRYLAYGDFSQVREGVKSRENLFIVAPHLVHRSQFVVPVKSLLHRFVFRLGLSIYSLFAGLKNSAYVKWINRAFLRQLYPGINEGFIGAYTYMDGILNDSRLVMERVLAARQEGAICLNYAEVEIVGGGTGRTSLVKFKDALSGKRISLEAGIVVNCAGQWGDQIGGIKGKRSIRLSRGAHIIFDIKWPKSPVLIQLEKFGTAYFIWPYYEGSLVGTTDIECDAPESHPAISEEELNELLTRLARDFPGAGFKREKIRHTFVGIRALPRDDRRSDTSSVSRRALWSYSHGMISLRGGKFTTSASTVDKGMAIVQAMAGMEDKPASIQDRIFPGAWRYLEIIDVFEKKREQMGAPKELFRETCSRFGALIRFIFVDESDWEVVGGIAFRGEIRFSLEMEQAITLDDILGRRLQIYDRYGRDHIGIEAVSTVFKEFKDSAQSFRTAHRSQETLSS